MDQVRPAPGTEKFRRARQMAALHIRGQKRSAESRERIRAVMQARGQSEIARRKIAAWNSSPVAKAIHWVQRVPNERLTPEELEQRAQVISRHMPGYTPGKVIDLLRPYLQKRGLQLPRSKGGRPHSVTWCTPLVGLIQSTQASSRLPQGFWESAARRIDGQLDGPTLRDAAYDHRIHCPLLAAALPARSARKTKPV
jgi:hypothetical protein